MSEKYTNLYEQVYSFKNLWIASRKARKGKRTKKYVREFEYNLEENLFDIQKELRDENYIFGDYNIFTITDPKEREIAAAPYRDRVVHHALCNVIEPILDKVLFYHSYACRKNKGSHKAIEKAAEYIMKNQYCLKIDIKKYFFTIDQMILIDLLERKFQDPKIISFIRKILDTYFSNNEYYFPFPQDSMKERERKRGLPIGNLTSQLFANYYLDSYDRYIKEKLKVKCYLRYMDDSLIFGNNKEELREYKLEIKNYLSKLRLTINENKSQIISLKNGVKFLGLHIYKGYKKIHRENLQRFRRRIKLKKYEYYNSKITFEKLLLSLNGWKGFCGKNGVKISNKILKNIVFLNVDNNKKFTFILC